MLALDTSMKCFSSVSKMLDNHSFQVNASREPEIYEATKFTKNKSDDAIGV